MPQVRTKIDSFVGLIKYYFLFFDTIIKDNVALTIYAEHHLLKRSVGMKTTLDFFMINQIIDIINAFDLKGNILRLIRNSKDAIVTVYNFFSGNPVRIFDKYFSQSLPLKLKSGINCTQLI